MQKHNCESCKLRAKHDKAPKSLVGRFWRWHINFCPGWKSYINTLDDEKKSEIALRYNIIKEMNINS